MKELFLADEQNGRFMRGEGLDSEFAKDSSEQKKRTLLLEIERIDPGRTKS